MQHMSWSWKKNQDVKKWRKFLDLYSTCLYVYSSSKSKRKSFMQLKMPTKITFSRRKFSFSSHSRLIRGKSLEEKWSTNSHTHKKIFLRLSFILDKCVCTHNCYGCWRKCAKNGEIFLSSTSRNIRKFLANRWSGEKNVLRIFFSSTLLWKIFFRGVEFFLCLRKISLLETRGNKIVAHRSGTLQSVLAVPCDNNKTIFFRRNFWKSFSLLSCWDRNSENFLFIVCAIRWIIF